MTPNEFKAWFDGFTEAFEGRIPTKAQWGRIKDRVAEIDGKPAGVACGGNLGSNNATTLNSIAFNSSQAMNDLGWAEAASLAA